MKNFSVNTKMKNILKISCTTIIVVVFLLSGCTNHPKADKIRIGYVPIAVTLPLFVANDEGYFKEQGFEVEMVRFASSNEVGNAGTTGQVDILSAASNVVFDIGFVSNNRHKLILPNLYTNKQGNITDYILVSDTLNIKTITDLKGKKIGIFPGSVIKVFCTLILEKYGLNKNEYTLIELSPKDWAAALQTKQIDALSALEPQASQLMIDKIGFPIAAGFYAQLMPNVPLSGNWISEDFYNKYGDEAAEKIIIAVDKAVDFINKNPEKAKEYLVKYANVREDVVNQVQLNPWTKHSEINYLEIQKFIDVLFENKAIQNNEDINNYKIK